MKRVCEGYSIICMHAHAHTHTCACARAHTHTIYYYGAHFSDLDVHCNTKFVQYIRTYVHTYTTWLSPLHRFVVYDYDMVSRDDFLGAASIPIRRVKHNVEKFCLHLTDNCPVSR